MCAKAAGFALFLIYCVSRGSLDNVGNADGDFPTLWK